jgi:HAD superfamily hydrolase (TIGR01490 family)
MKKFAVFDIDGTLIRWQLYHSIADTLARLGHISPKAHQSIKDARMLWKRRAKGASFESYERQVINSYDAAIKKLSMAQFEQAAQAVFEEYKDQTYNYTRELLKTHKKSGYTLLAISGSQTEIVAKIANYYGFDDYSGSTYIYKDGRFTGAKRIIARYKGAILEELIKKHKLNTAGSIAVGDSSSDIPLLEKVEQPIAFNPERKLFKHASTAGWKIVIERKNIAYELGKDNGKYTLVKTSTG